MTGSLNPKDEQLSRLLHDTVDGIEPRHGLDAIRSRTLSSHSKESTMSVARTWLLGGLGGAVATATVIGGVWFASNNLGDDNPGQPVTPPTSSVTPTDTGSPSPSDTPTGTSTGAPTETFNVPAYFAGDTPAGLRLYREFDQVEGTSKLDAAVRQTLSGIPADSDYRSLWLEGTSATTTYNGDVITVDLWWPEGKAGWNPHDRQEGMDATDASLAIEQVIYTAQAALGKGRVPVQFLILGKHTDQVLGQPASEPLSNASVLDTLSHVNLTTPAEGDEITGDSLAVSGVANSFEANVIIRLQRYEGTYIALQKPLTAEGWMEDKLFPFSGSFDISGVAPGKYILMAMTDDPSGGAEGNGAFSDTKIITIK
jgi:hypothetical protein